MFSEDTTDLFEVFESEEAIKPNQQDGNSMLVDTKISLSKRPSETGEEENEEYKKTKVDHGRSVLTDSFEQAMEREVPKAKTGLTKEEAETKITHQVRHQVALPPDYSYIPISQHKPLDPPAKEYPFELDPFQKVSIHSIERNESVLVAAHTSAGKTVVAEYAIAQSLRDKQRVIYTSPIKALSNQKYRELLQEFGDVGLMTGDITINPTASCLVMTTEILRSMLYRGSEVMREIAWVIFDEIHYMRDKERGVVWEETLILLPHQVHYVFLSATIPNALQFAEWICKLHDEPCHVVYTDFRPTPLQHYLFPAGGDGIHLVMDEKGLFRENNFQKAVSFLSEERVRSEKKQRNKKGSSDIYKLVKMLMIKKHNPVIVFSFSRRECEALALQMSKLDLNEESEKEMVATVFKNAVSSLSPDDQALPQIESIFPLLQKGIGIHHSGLLPILKEVIEILFQEGLLKVLFATETFAIGLNMPAKTVVFTSVRKFDGKEFRWVSSGEYIQMSGRAGRRGLDDRGIVVLMLDEKMQPASAKNMIKGQADALNSAFHLSYNMILNLLRFEGSSPEYILEKSFYQFQNENSVHSMEDELKQLEEEYESLDIQKEDQIAEYYNIQSQLKNLNQDMKVVITHPTYALPFMQPGRLVRIQHEEVSFGWGVVVNFQKRISAKKKNNKEDEEVENASTKYIIDVLLYCDTESNPNGVLATSIRPCPNGQKGEFMVVPVLLSTVEVISNIRIHLPKDLKSSSNRHLAYKSVKEVERRFSDGIPLLNPIEHMNIRDDEFKKLVKKVEMLEIRQQEHALHRDTNLKNFLDQFQAKVDLKNRIKAVKKRIQTVTSIIQLDELKARRRVLRRLGFSSASDVIEIKGRVACEISTGDELLLTELMFNGVFNDLTPEQTVALLSCFVFDEKTEQQSQLKEELATPLRVLQETARRIAKVSNECKFKVNEDEYVQSFRSDLMDVVYAWSQGAKFIQISKMTDIFEGSIIRAFRRLDELLKQMCAAAKSIGNTELEEKFTQAIKLIKRDIIFAASLYL